MILPTRIRRHIASALAGGTIFLLAACASDTLVHQSEGRTTESAYGNYLAARYASGQNDVYAAADYYAAALSKEPQNPLLQKQAFLSALMAGRITKSAAYARPVLGSEAESNLMRLGIVADALAVKKYSEAQSVLATGKYGPFNGEVRKLLQGWAAYGTGDAKTALSFINSTADAPVFSRIVHLNLALVLDLEGRDEEAEAAYKKAAAFAQISDRSLYAYGSFLERHNRPDEARALYQKGVEVFTQAPLCHAALKDLDARKDKKRAKPPAPLVRTAREGAAEALYGTAQILAAQAHFDKALVYLEMARFINPNHGATIQLLARVMEVERRPEDALALFSSIAPKSPYREGADLNRARALFRMDRRDEAVEIFRALAETHPDDDDLVSTYADVLRSIRDYEKALPIFDRLIERQGKTAGWQLHFSRGTVLERLGRWQDSVLDFKKALSLDPNQPDVLNYLGYTYINAGEHLDEGFALIEKALSLRPDAGYIIDSLGWAHYRLGHYEPAVRYLERAVELEPGEPTISDHLADAYWQAGRHLEARFQWTHTLSLKADDDIDFDVVREKLDHGLRDAPEVASATP
jgi:tetratricopeptide (TPR) repeat protein